MTAPLRRGCFAFRVGLGSLRSRGIGLAALAWGSNPTADFPQSCKTATLDVLGSDVQIRAKR